MRLHVGAHRHPTPQSRPASQYATAWSSSPILPDTASQAAHLARAVLPPTGVAATHPRPLARRAALTLGIFSCRRKPKRGGQRPAQNDLRMPAAGHPLSQAGRPLSTMCALYVLRDSMVPLLAARGCADQFHNGITLTGSSRLSPARPLVLHATSPLGRGRDVRHPGGFDSTQTPHRST